ncbi:MAG: response regulator [SAR324 cluster bacterium]|nr:response regulator [SAR324 cluster bacterium]
MNKFTILCVDDEREVLDSVVQDLDALSSMFDIEAANSVREAREIIEDLERDDRQLALALCDHIMPEIKGIDYLIELNQEEFTESARKVLLTGQAGLEDTIQAINRGGLHYYVSKPWTAESLMKVVVDQLTTFIIANEPHMMNYARVLDQARIFGAVHKVGGDY